MAQKLKGEEERYSTRWKAEVKMDNQGKVRPKKGSH